MWTLPLCTDAQRKNKDRNSKETEDKRNKENGVYFMLLLHTSYEVPIL
jgi:hypothetical protein